MSAAMPLEPAPDERSRIAETPGSLACFACLGASNLTLLLPRLLEEALRRLPGRGLEVYAAHGPGRSYGTRAGVLGFTYPGLAESGLLESLARRAAPDAWPGGFWALLTDIGNDILYGAGVERISGWVARLATGLAHLGARVGITSLPLASLENASEVRFRLLRPFFYPFRPMPRAEVLRQAQALQKGIEGLARSHGLVLLPAPAAWYGFDRFHLGARGRREAVACWLDALIGPLPAGSRGRNEAPRVPGTLRVRPPAGFSFLGLGLRRSGAVAAIDPRCRVSIH